VQRLHVNNSTEANGSADQGWKRLRVNFVGCPGITSMKPNSFTIDDALKMMTEGASGG
jgi:hypothetical protein